MALAQLADLKEMLTIGSTDLSQDGPLTLALNAASAAFQSFAKRLFDRTTGTFYPTSGLGTNELVLPQYPALCYSLAGSISSGAAVVTGLSSTASLVAGMPAVHADVPHQTTISTVDSTTQVTLSANATAAVSAETIVFGLEVHADSSGHYGDASGAFASTSRLVLGSEFALERDQADGTSKSAVLRRLGGGPASVGEALWAEWPAYQARGALTARAAAVWPGVKGSVRVKMTYGYATIPDDVQSAVRMLAAWTYMHAPRGGLVVGNESLSDEAGSYSYSLTALRTEPEMAEARGIARSYRQLVI